MELRFELVTTEVLSVTNVTCLVKIDKRINEITSFRLESVERAEVQV